MARISVEQQALTDSRFTQLGLLIYGLHKPGAPEENLCPTALGIGVAAHVWNECQEQGRHVLDSIAVNSIGFHLGIRNGESLSTILVECDLAERVGRKQLRIKGTEGRTEWLQKRREDGKLGAEYGVTGGRPRKPPTGLPEKPPLTPTPTPTPTEESEKTTTLVRPKRSNGSRVAPTGIVKPSPLTDPERVRRLEEDFITLYQFYPRHVGKDSAWLAFTRLDPDVDTLHEIAKDIKKRTNDGEWVPTDPERVRFIPHLSTYLNQRRWTDGE